MDIFRTATLGKHCEIQMPKDEGMPIGGLLSKAGASLALNCDEEEGIVVELPPRVSELGLPFDVEELDLPSADSECNFTADQISEINSKTLELHREFFDFVKRKYEIIELRYVLCWLVEGECSGNFCEILVKSC